MLRRGQPGFLEPKIAFFLKKYGNRPSIVNEGIEMDLNTLIDFAREEGRQTGIKETIEKVQSFGQQELLKLEDI